ncbi:UNKNOWN [Stylonychia lemnae]|uniref:Uncharacterized protein n=1 Tax=Stylonychia lemnae TaxID=5949 RepID=A0A077ZR60_STYLE|nr:UNKNOWN [Stylonychia lemnae]|eukprot:CDW71825.1 UNKNOWN [Stylonychia lemnae]
MRNNQMNLKNDELQLKIGQLTNQIQSDSNKMNNNCNQNGKTLENPQFDPDDFILSQSCENSNLNYCQNFNGNYYIQEQYEYLQTQKAETESKNDQNLIFDLKNPQFEDTTPFDQDIYQQMYFSKQSLDIQQLRTDNLIQRDEQFLVENSRTIADLQFQQQNDFQPQNTDDSTLSKTFTSQTEENNRTTLDLNFLSTHSSQRDIHSDLDDSNILRTDINQIEIGQFPGNYIQQQEYPINTQVDNQFNQSTTNDECNTKRKGRPSKGIVYNDTKEFEVSLLRSIFRAFKKIHISKNEMFKFLQRLLGNKLGKSYDDFRQQLMEAKSMYRTKSDGSGKKTASKIESAIGMTVVQSICYQYTKEKKEEFFRNPINQTVFFHSKQMMLTQLKTQNKTYPGRKSSNNKGSTNSETNYEIIIDTLISSYCKGIVA